MKPSLVSSIVLMCVASVLLSVGVLASSQGWPKSPAPGESKPAPAPKKSSTPSEEKTAPVVASPDPVDEAEDDLLPYPTAVRSQSLEAFFGARLGYRETQWRFKRVDSPLGSLPAAATNDLDLSVTEIGLFANLRDESGFGFESTLSLFVSHIRDSVDSFKGGGVGMTVFGYKMFGLNERETKRDALWSAVVGANIVLSQYDFEDELSFPVDYLKGPDLSFAPYLGISFEIGEPQSALAFDFGLYYDVPVSRYLEFDSLSDVELVFGNETGFGLRGGIWWQTGSVILGARFHGIHQNAISFYFGARI